MKIRNLIISVIICALIIFGLPVAISSILFSALGGWQLGETVSWLVEKTLGAKNE